MDFDVPGGSFLQESGVSSTSLRVQRLSVCACSYVLHHQPNSASSSLGEILRFEADELDLELLRILVYIHVAQDQDMAKKRDGNQPLLLLFYPMYNI